MSDERELERALVRSLRRSMPLVQARRLARLQMDDLRRHFRNDRLYIGSKTARLAKESQVRAMLDRGSSVAAIANCTRLGKSRVYQIKKSWQENKS